ncbi:hypothetical protein PRUPE_1G223100 [Prunus persica]|uniref:Protein FAR1-RELATED SEQUENCE n=1 Tax=Prunus persica TaxID=3760 RepID=A0A251R1G8_PRUPE|nr:hypothetical protein PRUPE_1G223100 [Prunus persica]
MKKTPKATIKKKNPTFGNLEETSDENLYGKIVYNEQEAYDLYNEYGASIGLSIRRKQKRYDKYGVVRQLNFVCSKEGFREDSDPCKEKAIDRLETRTGCKAKIRFLLEGDVWKFSTFNPDHNHKLARLDERQFLQSNRDAQSLINLFKHKQVEDPVFFYTMQIDQENRMTNLFGGMDAMANAISTVFLGTCHFLCTWHISRNATLKLASSYAISEFKRLFNKCLEGGETKFKFECTWNEMISEFDLADNTWLKTLYQLREKWCPVFSLDTFTVRIKASQRSQSMNNVFHHMCTKTMRLTEFVHHYDKQTHGMRSRELEETFRHNQGLPSRAAIKSGLLLHAANIYTRKKNIYLRLSCKMFESMGLLCRHALRVLNVKEVTKIPSQYILKRWTKEAKKG